MTQKTRFWAAGILLAAFVAGFRLSQAYGCPAAVDGKVDQGCVNQGADCRVFGTAICWMQRQFSWKSEHEPSLVRIGRKGSTHLAFAWPPYTVYNSPQADGRWRVFRVGFRYDRTWRGYIFPTIAWKERDSPLEY